LKRLAATFTALLSIVSTVSHAQTSPVEKMLYDDHGKSSGIEVRINGVTLTVHSENDSVFKLNGMPTISIEKEATTSRHVGVRLDGRQSVRFVFDGAGYLRSAVIGQARLELSLPSKDGMVTETLHNSTGRIVAKATVKGDTPSLEPNPPFCLDAVKTRLGLTDASVSLQIEKTEGSALTTIRNDAGQLLLYVVTYGGNRFGFDAAGKSLFVDAAIEMAHSSLAIHGSEHNPVAIHQINAVVPSRIVVTEDGTIAACVDGPATGAIAAFWSVHSDKGDAVAFRVKNSRASDSTHGSRRRLQPRVTAGSCISIYEGTTQICYDTAGLDCEAPIEHYGYYCTSTVSGGGSTTTGGGGGSASNQISGDTALKTQVGTGLSTAQTKLNNCAAALLGYKALNGQTLGTMLAAKANPPAGGWTLQSFISNGSGQIFKMDTDSNPNGYCAAGYPAHTDLYQNTTYVCEREFNTQTSTLTTMDQWAILIHEELHTLGYPENPPYNVTQTPSSITADIKNLCN